MFSSKSGTAFSARASRVLRVSHASARAFATVILTGLCASALAITTNSPVNTLAAADTAGNPLAISPSGGAGAPMAPGAAVSPLVPIAPIADVTHMALLLPAHSSLFGAAADAVRTGFLTAYERDKQGVEVSLVESGDTPADMVRAYTAALDKNDIIVGPLSRTGAAAIAQSGRVVKPTVALTQPEGDDPVLPPNMLVVALAVEEEARQVANWVEIDKTGGRIFAVSTAAAWQRRAVKAFLGQSKALGMDAVPLELSASGGGTILSASGLAQLKQRIDTDRPALLFIALDAQQAKQLRSAIGAEMPLYGISQLNPRSLSAASTANANSAAATNASVQASVPLSATAATTTAGIDAALPAMQQPELNGVKLLDIPWQLSLDHPAVALYPRPLVEDPQKHNADMDRLYALGIDAYRVALEIGRSRRSFDIDGVTGKLSISIDPSGSHFQRIETRAIYQDGIVVPTASQP